VRLLPGEADDDNNFIDGRPGIICGTVLDDTGQPISNVEMQLWLDVNNNDSLDVADTQVATTFTDGDSGIYCFEDVVPGEYIVFELQPANYNSVSDYDHTTGSTDPDGTPSADDPDDEIAVSLTPNESDNDNDYIEDPFLGSISGHVFNEVGAGINGVTITLYADADNDGNEDGPALANTTTNATGDFIFTGVEPGRYVVVETNPANYSSISDYDTTTGTFDLDGDDSGQGADNDIPVRLLPGEADNNNDFTDGRPGMICGSVSEDTGLPIFNVEIRLYRDVNNNDSLDVADILVTTVFTDTILGEYCFTNVMPGEYVVSEIQPANYDDVSDYDHSTSSPDTDGMPGINDPDNEIAATVTPNETDNDNDFIEDPFTGIISGFVKNDALAPIPGVTLSLYADTDNDGNEDGPVLFTAITNGSGAYTFSNIEPGRYVVVETQPFYHNDISDFDESISGADLDGNDNGQGPDNDVPVILKPGETDADNNFVDGRPGLICGTVLDDTGQPISSVELRLYQDVNNNDTLDAADIQLAIQLSDGDSGNYCFEDVTPGEYIVVEIQPANYNSVSDYDHTTGPTDPDGTPGPNDPDDEIAVTLVPNESDTQNDFIEDPFLGSISGFVKNEIDAPIVGITLSLFNDTNMDGNPDGTAIANVTTNSSGYYVFTGVEPRFYVVVETQPLYHNSLFDYDYTTGAFDNDGNDSGQGPDENIPVRLLPGEADEDNNFIDGRPGIICGSVTNDLGQPMSNVEVQLWEDENGNGQLDTGDDMLTVQYSDGDTGNYCFEDVVPDTYIVVEVQIPTYGDSSDVDATPDPDGDDSADGTDNNIPVVLEPNENDEDNNFIDIVCPSQPQIEGFEIDTICSGESVVLIATNQGVGNVNYSWTFGSGSAPTTGTGIGPHTVTYTSNPTNSTIGATVILTISKPGCMTVMDSVATIVVNPLPSAAISGSTANLCYFAPRTFQPTVAYVPGYTYQWNFGAGANIPTATGWGPHTIEYSTTGSKTVTLTVSSNAPGANCTVVGTVTFNVVTCFGNITGRVRTQAGVGIGDVTVKLFNDTNYDGISDGGTAVRTVLTTSTGTYSMVNLVPGQYVIVETQPSGYYSLSDGDATNDNDSTVVNNSPNDDVIPVTVEPQEIDADNNFTEVPSPGIVNGYVFEDIDNDNFPDAGEGLPGVILTVYTDTDQNGVADANGFVNTDTTSNAGFYAIGDLAPGHYVVFEAQPPNYTSESDFDATNDNDAVPNTNMMNDTIPFTITNAETDADNYFIDVEVPACSGIVTNINDSGPGSLRFAIDCAEPGDTITFDPSLLNQVIHLTSTKIVISKNIYIHSSLVPRIMIYSDVPGAFEISSGFNVEMKNIEITSGLTGTLGAGIENHGQLVLWDVCVYRNPLLPPANHLIHNSGGAEILFRGACHIQMN